MCVLFLGILFCGEMMNECCNEEMESFGNIAISVNWDLFIILSRYTLECTLIENIIKNRRLVKKLKQFFFICVKLFYYHAPIRNMKI